MVAKFNFVYLKQKEPFKVTAIIYFKTLDNVVRVFKNTG